MENNIEEKIIAERKEKLFSFFKNNYAWIFYLGLILIVILGVYIRYQPLIDHGGHPGLWDSTTNDYTLGPDLDPFLFLRYARTIIENGSLGMDNMRYVPLGFDTTVELQMVSYMIVLTHKICSIFGQNSINFAGAFMPVWFFGLTIIAFFFFVRELFLRKDDKNSYIKANIIALISTLFMTVIPAFLSRTVAGIPEKESVGFFFMFLSFFLFLKAWKSEKILSASIIGVLAGISTALMGLTWGGVTYIYITIALASLVGFILNKVQLKESLVYWLWLISAFTITLTFTNRFSLKGFVLGIDTGLATFVFGLLFIHFILWKTKIGKHRLVEEIKLPKSLVSLIVLIILGLIAIITLFGPSYVFERISQINEMLIKPVTGRWNTTVAENKQPYFTEWYGNFGKPIFWLFFLGSIVLFKKMLKHLEKRDSWILTLSYILFFFGVVFSRYASHPSILDGENFLSKFIYYGSALLFAATIIYYYNKYHKQNHTGFEKIEFDYIFLLTFFVITLFTARSAVRLIMVLVPIAPIFIAYLIGELIFKLKEEIKKDSKILITILLVILIIISGFYTYNYYKEIKAQSYGYVPYAYTMQWQEAMSWVRNNTASDAVFAHWWDYGYWVQSIGDRPTMTDGGNAITWWNYLTGRYVLTGDNQQDSLNVLYNHNVSYLLIDSTDIGKYGAFSQIGSDINYDRFSYGPTVIVSDQSQIQETANGTRRIYQANTAVDEDIKYNDGTKDIFIPGFTIDSNDKPAYNAALIGIIIDTYNKNNQTFFKQPTGVFYYQGIQTRIPIRYLYLDGKLQDFKTGINASVSLIKKIDNDNGQFGVDSIGAGIYLSPRVFRGFLGQVYILNDPFNKFPNFKVSHVEKDLWVDQLEQYSGQVLGDFVYYQGLRGPIKIWKVGYTGTEKINPEYLATVPPSYITWKF
jgi:asparagine N-glycosylation enzyme membrane subunit Stt3